MLLLWIAIVPAPSCAVEFMEIVAAAQAEKHAGRPGFEIANFDQWVFNDRKNIRDAEKQLLERLQGEADSVQSSCRLADRQKDKLLLAGRGDIQEFLVQYTETRSRFAENINDQQALQNLWQEIQPLQQKYHGKIYGTDSLFTKVLDHMLDKQQSSLIEKIRKAQREFQYQATVLQLVAQIDQIAPFTHQQRRTLLALIDRHTSPPQAGGGKNRNQLRMAYLFSQMAKIPEDRLRPLFGRTAWKVVNQQIRRGVAMQPDLQQHGLVPELE